MKVAIRVDASSQIGTGHIMRCLVLAKKLIERGHEVVLLSRPLTGNLIDYCKTQGVDVISLKTIQETFLPDAGDYRHWLGVTQEADANECLAALEAFQPDWIAMDHYALDREWQDLMRTSGTRIFTIDDLANREHKCDVLLDHNPWPDFENRYHQVVSKECTQLLGPKFGLLRPRFSELRQQPPALKNVVLAFFSGTDPSGECIKLLNASRHFDSLPFRLHVVHGLANPRRDEIASLPLPEFVTLSENLPDYEAELAACRYAFGGAGVSAIERASLGVPGTLVSVAENQRQMAEHLGASGLYRYLGVSDKTTEHDYANELKWLAEHWKTLPYRLEKSDIDGNGAQRVVEVMESLCPTEPNNQMIFRPMTTEDLPMVRGWRNDPGVREMMFTQHEISAEEHERWFAKASTDATKQFFIAHAEGTPVGMVSFTEIERQSNTAEWGFYKSPEAPSGTGFTLLFEALHLGFDKLRLEGIRSRVLCSNPKVLYLHHKLGFSKERDMQTLITAEGDKDYFAFFLSREDWNGNTAS
ncbi:pseudaminic acid cytidylyltransferase [Grimontia sp. AD028]|uniref:UDP-2,4-diacetamido-2,4, 6-trideoxy-beta-L-altropyranose hydrolase n=1 Tax=Grimontia sp. AD028 TaxID=1581149 RepID=UPI00061B07FC|nr:UDP-2,4-diacetamido-2,4,6-trideoxy-beta-L-altropyranose hydrolase [Grimontia sp. AD028]KKD59474.1 pseudaminic acid cytidylyltransferase [Grimontia sp. AD028]